MVPISTTNKLHQNVSLDQHAPEPYGAMVCAHECLDRTCVPGRTPAAASAVTPITGQCGLRGRSRHPDSLRSRSSSNSVDNRLRGGVACCRPFPTRWPWKPSATSNAAHQPDGHRRVGVDRNPPVGTMDIPSIARKPSSNVATNSAPCRRAAATIAASAKLNRAALRMRNSRNAAGKRSEQGRKSSSSASSRISLRRTPPDVHVSRALPSRLRETRTRSTEAVRIRLEEGTPWRMRPPGDARRVRCGTR